jgi:hypothetical protein
MYNVRKILLEVFSKEPIHYVKYSSLSLIIELNFKELKHLPFFLFFLVGVFPFSINLFENIDENADICGLFEELQ